MTGIHLIYEALKKTRKDDGDALVRGDGGHVMGKPARPDLDRSGTPRHLQNILIRKVERWTAKLDKRRIPDV